MFVVIIQSLSVIFHHWATINIFKHHVIHYLYFNWKCLTYSLRYCNLVFHLAADGKKNGKLPFSTRCSGCVRCRRAQGLWGGWEQQVGGDPQPEIHPGYVASPRCQRCYVISGCLPSVGMQMGCGGPTLKRDTTVPSPCRGRSRGRNKTAAALCLGKKWQVSQCGRAQGCVL